MNVHEPTHPGGLIWGHLDDIVDGLVEGNNMTVTAIADFIGINRVVLSDVLNGRTSVPTEMDLILADWAVTDPGYWLELQAQHDLRVGNRQTAKERAIASLHAADSYSRMEAVLQLRYFGVDSAWWEVLGENWSTCDDIAKHKEELEVILAEANEDDLRLMMSANDLREFESLPDELTVYRGCYHNNRDGLSWSLSKDIAAGFTKLHRYKQDGETALLLTGKAKRSHSVLKNDRKEREIVCPTVTVLNEEQVKIEHIPSKLVRVVDEINARLQLEKDQKND